MFHLKPRKTVIASALLLIAALFLKHIGHGEEVPPNKPFSVFPLEIGSWSGKQTRFDEKIYEILGVDDSILCNYSRDGGRQVQLYVGYYRNQREGDQIHSPKNCMPGAGWNITKTSLEELPFSWNEGGKTNAIRLLIEKNGNRQVVLYWFQSRGRFIASEYAQKIYHVIDSITRRRTDGAFVRLIAPVIVNEEKAVEDLRDFAVLLIPILSEYIPS